MTETQTPPAPPLRVFVVLTKINNHFMEQSNDLRYSTTKTVGNEVITVKISLNDDCKNGHQDFSITGDIYQAGKPRTDRFFISGGCIHDDIKKHFPEFIPFIKLHLCDYDGVPMHPVANGFYHLQQGFNNTKPESPAFAAEYCEYYRITPAQFEALKTCRNQVQYGLKLAELNILAQWKEEAKAGIAALEKLSGKKFVNDSKRSQYIPPTPAEIEEEAKRQAEGYYTPQAEARRNEEAKQKEFQKLEDEYNKEVTKARIEYEAKKELLTKGGKTPLDNCIYYNHTKQIAFNWRGYDNLPDEYLNALIATLKLPEGVTAIISKKK